MKTINFISILVLTIFLSSVVLALQSEKIYFLDLAYNEGAFKLIDISLITGYPAISSDNSLPYKLELFSSDNELLSQGYFDVPNKFFAPPPLESGEISGIFELENLIFSISLPYHKEGHTIIISKDESKLLQIEVPNFSAYCGDLICQPDENNKNCPSDCVTEEKTYSSLKFALITVGVLIVLILIILLYLSSKKKNN